MDRGAWWATVHGGHKEVDTTEPLTLSLQFKDGRQRGLVTRRTVETAGSNCDNLMQW